jgi:TonB family protein
MLMLLTRCSATPRRPERSSDAAVRRAVGTLLALVAAGSGLSILPALAQTPPAPSTSAPSEVAPSERAKRDADKVFHWIMIQGDRTRKAPAAAKETKETKETKEAKDNNKDDRPAARPIRTAAPEAAPARPKAEATVAAAAPSNPRPAGKPAELPNEAPAPATASVAAPEAPKQDDSRVASIESRSGDAAPAVELTDDAPQGLVALAQPAPEFPINVMRTLRRGTVQVRFSVMTDGSVADLEVLNTTSPRLNAAALAGIAQWRFQPVSKVQTGAVEVGFNLD